MKDIFEQFEEQAKKVSLSSEEKQGMRARLSLFAEAHPVRNLTDVHQTKNTEKQSLFSHLFIFKLRPMFIALVIALVLGGSTAFAAENALPGDTLYPVKIHVNEQVRDAIEISAEKQAEWDLKKAERRLLEAEKLAQQGKLNASVRSDIESRIEKNIDRANDAKNNDENKNILAANLGSLFRAHSDILERILSNSGDRNSRAELQLVLNTIRRAHTSTTITTSTGSGNTTTSTNTGSEQAARGKLQAAEHKLAEVERFISKKWSGFTGATTLSTTTPVLETKVKAKLQMSRDLIAQGKLKLTAGLYREAFHLFQDSMGVAEEAKILVATAHELKIDRRDGDRDDRNTTSTDSRGQNDDNDDNDKKEDKDDDQEKEDDSRGGTDSERGNSESNGRGRN